MAVTELLEELRQAYLERGRNVDRHLRPGLDRDEILSRTRDLALTLPDELVEMYRWRNGQDGGAEMSVDAMLFRDHKFVDIDGALREYPLVQEQRRTRTRSRTASSSPRRFRSRRSRGART